MPASPPDDPSPSDPTSSNAVPRNPTPSVTDDPINSSNPNVSPPHTPLSNARPPLDLDAEDLDPNPSGTLPAIPQSSPPSLPHPGPSAAPPLKSGQYADEGEETAAAASLVSTNLDAPSTSKAVNYLVDKLSATKSILLQAQALCLRAEVGYVNIDLENIAMIKHGYHNPRPFDETAARNLSQAMDSSGDQRMLNPVCIVVKLEGLVTPPSPSLKPEDRPVLEVHPHTVVNGLAGQHRLRVGSERYLALKAKMEALKSEGGSQNEIDALTQELAYTRYWPARVFDQGI